MASKLEINNRISNDTVYIELDGVIDEDAVFDKIKNLKMSKYVFDFNKVKSINSCGIREWIKYIELIGATDITYVNCPQIIIEQANMVHGFIKKGIVVESFYAPYFCESCDDEKKVLLKSTDVVGGNAPVKSCVKCNSELEFDALPKQYFQFLNQGK